MGGDLWTIIEKITPFHTRRTREWGHFDAVGGTHNYLNVLALDCVASKHWTDAHTSFTMTVSR